MIRTIPLNKLVPSPRNVRRSTDEQADLRVRRRPARAARGLPPHRTDLGAKPRYLVAFAGNRVLERLVIQAKEQGICVVDRRGPLGVHPKRAARCAAATG